MNVDHQLISDLFIFVVINNEHVRPSDFVEASKRRSNQSLRK